MNTAVDWSDKRIGHLTVLSPSRRRTASGRQLIFWLCRCDCGVSKEIIASRIASGKKTSCGCYLGRKDFQNKRRSHSVSSGRTLERNRGERPRPAPTYISWSKMRDRCLKPTVPEYRYYGGRGITICERWSSFDCFIEDMGERPQGKSIDRIDPNGNYEPSNCRWATRSEQNSKLPQCSKGYRRGQSRKSENGKQ